MAWRDCDLSSRGSQLGIVDREAFNDNGRRSKVFLQIIRIDDSHPLASRKPEMTIRRSEGAGMPCGRCFVRRHSIGWAIGGNLRITRCRVPQAMSSDARTRTTPRFEVSHKW